MNWRVHVTVQARVDMHKAVLWYEEQQPNLGERFAQELERHFVILSERPLSGRRVKANIRRLSMDRFPYVLFCTYDAEAGMVDVLVICHTSRNPKTWQDRIL